MPDLAELSGLRGAVRGLSLHTHRPAMAQLQGGHRSAQRGRGLEFEEVRLYAPGDDTRNIDWRVTARRGKTHTKLFREERERPVWLVVDLHAGLYFGSRRQLKSAALLRTAAMLAWVASMGGDRVGAVIADANGETQIFPPRGREAGVLPILQALVAAQPRAPGKPVYGGLYNALNTLRPILQPGSLVLTLSDFIGIDATLEETLASSTLHSDFRLLWVSDPLEHEGMPAGRYRVGLPDRLWWMSGDSTRREWLHTWNLRAEKLQAMALNLNLPLSRISTQDVVVERMVALLREPKWAA